MDEIRFNSPSQNALAEQSQPKKSLLAWFKPFNFKKIFKFLGVLLILAAVVFVVFLSKYIFDKNFKNTNQPYSAVFLTNGQVYFGKMVENNEKEIVLNNVYYIQVNANTAPEKTANALNQTSFNLVKLGNELHGPTDQLFINRLQVVFYENLRDDSKVVESIKNYKQ